MTDAARPLRDESETESGSHTDEEQAARLAARREKLLAGAKPLRSMEELGIPDITEEEARAFAEAMGW